MNSQLVDKCEETKSDRRLILEYETRQMLKKRGLDSQNYYWCTHVGPVRMECKYHDDCLGLVTSGLCTKK